MTEQEYLHELDVLERLRISAETEAYRMQHLYQNSLREVDSVKDRIRQLNQAWVNQFHEQPDLEIE